MALRLGGRQHALLWLARTFHGSAPRLSQHGNKADRSSKAQAQQLKGDEPMKMEFDIEHNAPQHRQYLSFEGKGYGTPSQRQKQYAAMRAAQAYENVHDYQTQQISAKYETQIVRRDKEATRKRTLRSAIDRLVEDLIQESMARGEFKNLSGMGKPLKTSFDYNPMVDSTTHNLNKIMIQNGYAPEWIMLEKDIKQELADAREELLAERIKLGEPYTYVRQKQWEKHMESFNKNILNINKKVSTFNLVTPILRQQIMPYSTDREATKIMKKYEELLEKGELPEKEEKNNFVSPVSFSRDERISMAVVWKELKALFNS